MLIRHGFIQCLLGLTLVLLTTASFAGYSNKWRIEVSERARNDGILLFRFTPKGEDDFRIEVPIAEGISENSVAHQIRSTFRKHLSRDKFTVEVDDGEDVLVKRKRGSPVFDLDILEDTVKGTRINLDKE